MIDPRHEIENIVFAQGVLTGALIAFALVAVLGIVLLVALA